MPQPSELATPLYACTWTTWEFMMKDQKPPKLALDVGANDGGYTGMLRRGGYRVHLFEPVPEMFEECVKKHREDPNVVLNKKAVSDHSFTMEGVCVHNAWTLIPSQSNSIGKYKPFTAEFITLDDYCQNIGKIDFIKLDVDGYELGVLKGAEKTIRSSMPPIFFELSSLGEMVGFQTAETIDFILDLGYWFVALDGKHATRDRNEIMSAWPKSTSFDIFLLPEEWKTRVFERFR